MNEQLTQVGLNLAEVALKNTIEIINNKITAAKASKDKDSTIAQLEEIINQLIIDKLELERIAQQFKAEIERITISDEDIAHLYNTVKNIFGILPNFGSSLEDNQKEALLQLLNVDTLKALQLLGFNYKEAIGQPITELLASKINSFNTSTSRTTNQKNQPRKK